MSISCLKLVRYCWVKPCLDRMLELEYGDAVVLPGIRWIYVVWQRELPRDGSRQDENPSNCQKIQNSKENVYSNTLLGEDPHKKYNHLVENCATSAVIPSLPLAKKLLRECAKDSPPLILQGGGISLKGAAVPAPRLISSHELEHFRPRIEIKHNRHSGDVFEVLDGLMLKDGYLYKKVSIASVVYWGVQPSKNEQLKFTETSKTEDEDLSWLSSVFNVHKKKKPSNDTYAEGTSEKGSSFNLHDLVLYGRNGFVVIVDTGKDGIKILKGDPNVQEAMTIKS